MRAWKQVDLCDASFIENGSLRLGRLVDYAGITNGRADPHEGTIDIHVRTLSSNDPLERDQMSRIGFFGNISPSQHVMFHGGVFEHVVEPLYAFCMSYRGCMHDPDSSTPKATFEIENVERLARLICDKNRARISHYQIRPVKYKQRVYHAPSENFGEPSAFVKAIGFQHEQEIRIAFRPAPNTEYATLDTEPDPEIAECFVRVNPETWGRPSEWDESLVERRPIPLPTGLNAGETISHTQLRSGGKNPALEAMFRDWKARNQ